MNWYLAVLKKYAVFTGRACRTEYWMFILINMLITVAIGFVEVILGSPAVLMNLYNLAVLIPGLAVTVRRLHDAGHSGWFLLLGLIPLVGSLVLLFFMVQDSQPETNRFGRNPKTEAEYIDI
ncbi:MAG: hypothetical protein PWQ29_1600 [Verrucomicrobiota bacterium]|jgi:uncharacterized membrane protein YhaH (DUF805 family)|nr:hypothetical protein [Verrucomicrobiota bacterium]MDK2964206.1 hypothetical protein [Verrucomicrobiota bacterium]